VAQIEDDRLSDVTSDRRYIEATRDVLQQQGGLWFFDESFVISTGVSSRMIPLDPVAFARNFSLEATRPNASEIASLAAILAGGHAGLSHCGADGRCTQPVTAAAALRKAGLEPIAHIAARRIASTKQLRSCLRPARRSRHAAPSDHRGDVDISGPFPDALAIIQHGGCARPASRRSASGGYPEGHPRFRWGGWKPRSIRKSQAARAAGAGLCRQPVLVFGRAHPYLADAVAGCGIAVPVKIRPGGPASLTGLLRFAKRCGFRLRCAA